MPAHKPTVLVVDDEASIRQTVQAIVERAGWRSWAAENGKEALEAIERHHFDLVLLDVQLPDMNGLKVLAQLRERQPDVGVIMVSVIKEVPVAVDAMKLGAFDYILKDFSPSELSERIKKSLEQLASARELTWLRDEVNTSRKPMVVGQSFAMAEILQISDKVAQRPVSILLTGESGTGKEVLARYIHEHSDRSRGPFVAVNMPAIPADLVESTLFGHEKGAFTGAARQNLGRFELSSGGTLFLDEICELKLDLQAKLLRALQEHEIERVGGSRPVSLDLRFICATNRPIQELVAKGLFREDLYWRLNVVPIQMPPLRARREDVPELAGFFLSRYAALYGRPLQTLTPAASNVLSRYAWPGNVRELENLMERLVVVSDATVLDVKDLPLEMSVAADIGREKPDENSLNAAVAAFEKSYLLKILQHSGWNRRKAAEQLGIGYSTLKAKLKSYQLAPGTEED
jgi:DNA-binding NtrC family response regulator